MTRRPLTIGPLENLAVAREIMKRHGYRRLPVTREGHLVGILSEYDLSRHLTPPDHMPVEAAMTKNPIVVSSSETIERAANLMAIFRVGALPVVDNGR
ncbi:MAG TPA: CBS domain-containing protein, partial [Candidatus Binataceae bacterium]|nr:CBS domain-containing protein [Candidatus Binataceae bacterium]